MLKTLVLICAAAVRPSECTEQTALDVARFPPTPGLMCPFAGMAGMATIAGTAIRPEPGKSYLKTVCARVP